VDESSIEGKLVPVNNYDGSREQPIEPEIVIKLGSGCPFSSNKFQQANPTTIDYLPIFLSIYVEIP